MAVGRGSGDDRAKMAAEQAISSQLLDITIEGARGVLFNVTGGPNMTLFEVNQAAAIIRETAHPDVNMIFGAVIDQEMGDEIRCTVIATGFERAGGIPRRTLERPGRNDKPVSVANTPFARSSEPINVSVEHRSQAESKPASQPSINSDDLDIPTFLRNRR
jgi:cell division protein FtsZ